MYVMSKRTLPAMHGKAIVFIVNEKHSLYSFYTNGTCAD